MMGHVQTRVSIWLDPFAAAQGGGFLHGGAAFLLGGGGGPLDNQYILSPRLLLPVTGGGFP